ncbi:MAG: hypothetical protein WKF70_07185 [Chitinophagaceae bacterium]
MILRSGRPVLPAASFTATQAALCLTGKVNTNSTIKIKQSNNTSDLKNDNCSMGNVFYVRYVKPKNKRKIGVRLKEGIGAGLN